jgi:hypothetical protein
VETIEYKNYTIEIIQDDFAENPRESHEELGLMICFHSKYNLGDKHDHSKEDLKAMIKSGEYIYLPLYLYDHSGITMNTTGFSCPWDSGQVGYILASKKKIRQEYGWKKLTKERIERIKTYLKGEVETYDHYLKGDVYGYSIKDENDDEIDSCWGYYGYDHEASGLLPAAKAIVDHQVKETQIKEGVQTSLFDKQSVK